MNPVWGLAIAKDRVLVSGYYSVAEVAGPGLSVLSSRSWVGFNVACSEQKSPVVSGFGNRIRRPPRRVAGSAHPKNEGGRAPCEGGRERVC